MGAPSLVPFQPQASPSGTAKRSRSTGTLLEDVREAKKRYTWPPSYAKVAQPGLKVAVMLEDQVL